jgi:hypothetical protein
MNFKERILKEESNGLDRGYAGLDDKRIPQDWVNFPSERTVIVSRIDPKFQLGLIDGYWRIIRHVKDDPDFIPEDILDGGWDLLVAPSAQTIF